MTKIPFKITPRLFSRLLWFSGLLFSVSIFFCLSAIKAEAATMSIIPTKTGAVKACGDIFPHLKGKMDGMAFRVPVPTVSCAYMAFSLKKKTTAEEIHAALEAASKTKEMKGVLSLSHEQCVSIDFQTDPHSSIVDGPSTKVVDDTSAQVLSWYDNEWGYAMRVTEMAIKLGSFLF
jgi:glyceraldehyde 3-phosphate dehydrogenase